MEEVAEYIVRKSDENNEEKENNFNQNKKGLTLNALKYLAIAAMFISHLDFTGFSSTGELSAIIYAIGRITAPIMFFSLVEGYHKTRNKKKYALRLFGFALISYFPFSYMVSLGDINNLNLTYLNVIFTIFLGFVAIHIRREVKNIFIKSILISGILILSIPCDWGWRGILLALIFDFYYGNKDNQIFGYFIWAFLTTGMYNLILDPFENLLYTNEFRYDLPLIYMFEPFMFLMVIPLLKSYNGEKGKDTFFSRWIFYIFYPAHALLIGLLAKLFM